MTVSRRSKVFEDLLQLVEVMVSMRRFSIQLTPGMDWVGNEVGTGGVLILFSKKLLLYPSDFKLD